MSNTNEDRWIETVGQLREALESYDPDTPLDIYDGSDDPPPLVIYDNRGESTFPDWELEVTLNISR